MSVGEPRTAAGEVSGGVRRYRPPVRPRPRGPDRHSRRVALLKLLLPALGLTLLLLVAAWPRLGPLLDSVRITIPAIDLREARELKMVDPRYAGFDHHDRPFVVTAAIGRQVPNQKDFIALDRPRAEMTLKRARVVITAESGIYQTHAQLLDVFNDVTLTRTDGTVFRTDRMHIDFSRRTAVGHDPIIGRGPAGTISAQGFRILANADAIVFTGRSRLVLRGTKPHAVAPPPALPAVVVHNAAQIAAEAGAALARDAR